MFPIHQVPGHGFHVLSISWAIQHIYSWEWHTAWCTKWRNPFPSSLPLSSLPQFPVPSSLSPSVAFGSSFFGSSSSKVMSRWFKGFSQRGLEDAIFFWASHIYPLIMCMFTSLSKWFANSWSCRALRLEDFTPGEGKRYKHNNAQNETNNPYIVVRAYEGQFATSEHPAVPPTPYLAKAYEQGILEALVKWSPLHHPTNAAFDWRCQHGIMWMKGLPKQRETKEGEADDDTYLVPVAFYIGRRKPTPSEV